MPSIPAPQLQSHLSLSLFTLLSLLLFCSLTSSHKSVTVTYRPSHLEQLWIEHIPEWKLNVSREMSKQSVSFHRYLHALDDDRNRATIVPNELDQTRFPPHVFSYFEYTWPSGKQRLVPIEPISGILRHPSYKSPKDTHFLTDKSWLIVDPWQAKEEGRNHYYFDFGASTWDNGAGGASQQMFVEMYGVANVSFDRIYAFEVKHLDPNMVFSKIPKEILPNYQWYNIPISADPSEKADATFFLKKIATPDDFVIIKLDIDNTKVEEDIIQHLLDDPDALELIDELFWEHHVNLPEMNAWWWPKYLKVRPPHDKTLVNSDDFFRRFREAGVRAHSWV